MTDAILEFFSSLPNELYVFLISILPIIELRGAVPVGAILGMPFYLNYPLAVIGNILPVPFILLFIPKILSFLERFKIFRPMVRWLRGKAEKHSSKVIVKEQTAEDHETEDETPDVCEADETETPNGDADDADAPAERKMTAAIFISLMMFVALPIPGTGAWSGSLVASLFNLPKKRAFLAILLGVLICGVIMTLASYGVVGFLSFLA